VCADCKVTARYVSHEPGICFCRVHIFIFFFKRATGESGTGSGSLRGVGGKDLRERWFQDGLFWLDARSMPLDVRESRKRPQSADCCPTISNGTFFFLFLKFYFPSFPSVDATTARASRYNVIVFLLAIPRSPTKFPTP
jgi:hypothetical protein